MRIEGVYIELVASEPRVLAAFYRRLAGLETAVEAAHGVTLTGAALTVAIRKGVDPEPEGRGDGPRVGFVTAAANPDGVREELAAAGAVVLSEAKREGRRTFHCSDPVGYEFVVLVLSEESAAVEVSGAIVPLEPKVANEGRSVPESDALAGPPPRRVTRRDVDLLRDSARLANMQEAIAGLDVAFGAEDPAAVLDEMRAKLPPAASARDLAATDAALRAHHRATEAESLLERYKRDLRGLEGVVEPKEPERSSRARPDTPRPEPSGDEDAVDMARLRRSLGGSPDTEE